MIHVTLSLPADVESAVAEKVRKGGYPSLAAYLEAMLTSEIADDHERWEMTPELSALIEEGERSGYVAYDFQEIVAEARERYDAR